MPPSAHEFALQDMEFSNSEMATLARPQPGMASSKYLFFPGCQLTGSSPDHVKKTYKYLTDRLEGGVGLMLRCCGAPADWAGTRGELVPGLEFISRSMVGAWAVRNSSWPARLAMRSSKLTFPKLV